MPTGTKQTTNTSASSIRLLISPMTRDARNTIAKKGATLIGATNPQTSTSAASTHGHVANGRSRAHGRIRPKTTTFAVATPHVNRRSVTAVGRASSRSSVKRQFHAPIAHFVPSGLLVFLQQEIADREAIHFRSHEASIGIRRALRDRLSPHVERRIDDHRATRARIDPWRARNLPTISPSPRIAGVTVMAWPAFLRDDLPSPIQTLPATVRSGPCSISCGSCGPSTMAWIEHRAACKPSSA